MRFVYFLFHLERKCGCNFCLRLYPLARPLSTIFNTKHNKPRVAKVLKLTWGYTELLLFLLLKVLLVLWL